MDTTGASQNKSVGTRQNRHTADRQVQSNGTDSSPVLWSIEDEVLSNLSLNANPHILTRQINPLLLISLHCLDKNDSARRKLTAPVLSLRRCKDASLQSTLQCGQD